MSTTNYIMVTVAACDPTYAGKAFEHIGGLAADLKRKAGAVVARYGAVVTGLHAGCLVLFQGYEEMNGIDRAFGVYGDSSDYRALMDSGKLQVRVRNLWKIEPLQLGSPSADDPAYGVITRFSAPGLMLEQMQELVPIFEGNGAMIMRYGTLMTGENAGKRLLGVTYPSMDAIEKTYDGLRESDVYNTMLGEVELELRDIIRFVG